MQENTDTILKAILCLSYLSILWISSDRTKRILIYSYVEQVNLYNNFKYFQIPQTAKNIRLAYKDTPSWVGKFGNLGYLKIFDFVRLTIYDLLCFNKEPQAKVLTIWLWNFNIMNIVICL